MKYESANEPREFSLVEFDLFLHPVVYVARLHVDNRVSKPILAAINPVKEL